MASPMRLVPVVVLGALLIAPPIAAQERSPDDVAKFLEYVAKEKAYPEESILLMKQTWDRRTAEDPIREALRLLDPEYRAAADAFDEGRDDAALAAADRLVEADKNPYVTAYSRLLRVKLRMDAADLAPAIAELESLWAGSRERMTADHEVKFYIAFAHASAYEREEAVAAFQEYLSEFPDAPERYRTLARQLLRDLLLEGVNPLLDVAGRMGEIKSLLLKERTDEPTREKQDEVIQILDEIIAMLEEMEQQGSGGGGGGGGRGGRRGPPSGNRSNNPAQNSSLPGGSSSVGPLRRVSRGKAGEAWGDLRGKEREEVIQALKGKFPSRYTDLLEQYYRSLSDQ